MHSLRKLREALFVVSEKMVRHGLRWRAGRPRYMAP